MTTVPTRIGGQPKTAAKKTASPRKRAPSPTQKFQDLKAEIENIVEEHADDWCSEAKSEIFTRLRKHGIDVKIDEVKIEAMPTILALLPVNDDGYGAPNLDHPIFDAFRKHVKSVLQQNPLVFEGETYPLAVPASYDADDWSFDYSHRHDWERHF